MEFKVGDKVTYKDTAFLVDPSHRGVIKEFELPFVVVAWNTPCYQGDAREWLHQLTRVD